MKLFQDLFHSIHVYALRTSLGGSFNMSLVLFQISFTVLNTIGFKAYFDFDLCLIFLELAITRSRVLTGSLSKLN
jgi:hypothetical protein